MVLWNVKPFVELSENINNRLSSIPQVLIRYIHEGRSVSTSKDASLLIVESHNNVVQINTYNSQVIYS